MAVCIVAPAPASAWPPRRATPTPLRTTSATWNTKFPSALDLELPGPILYSAPALKPRLRLPALAPTTAVCRFDPFADDDEPPQLRAAHTPAPTPTPAPAPRENTPPLARGRCLTPLTISSSPAPAAPQAPSPTGRRRSPSFSAGSPSVGGTRVSLAALSAPSPAPYLSRPSTPTPPAPAPPHVPGAPSPFHARHYPTPDARARLLARTLLHRIHAVGRPRSPYSCSSSLSRLGASGSANGYESETGARAYVPSRLSESVVVAC